MCLKAATSFRGCSAVLDLIQNSLPQFDSRPAPNTVQSWLLRIGLHELLRPKERADDWVFIVDHAVQLGKMKCLLIVGIRLSDWDRLERPLILEDLTLITLELVKKSDGQLVYDQLQVATEKVGIPKAILSDQGSDISRGARDFQTLNPATLVLKDLAHATAIFLKHELTKDDRWDSFVKLCGTTQPKVKQTELGHLAPPKLKVKARYMNLGMLIGWAQRMLSVIETPVEQRPAQTNLERLDEKFGWIADYREAIVEWAELHAIKDQALEYGRNKGYHADAVREMRLLLEPFRNYPSSQRMVEKLLELIDQQCTALDQGIPASSEVLESLIGKGKRISGQHSRGGFTKTILGMAASVVDLTDEAIQISLETIGEADLRKWCKQHVGTSLTALRRRILPRQNATNTG